MQRLLLLISLLAVFGCAGPAGSGPADDADSAATRDDDIATAGDSAQGGDTAPVNTPLFELGTNTTGKSTPDTYKKLPEGSEINVELGPQGLWMVVLAFRTKSLLKPPLVLGGRVEMDGVLLGELKLGKQKLLPGPNSISYYYNFFLVVAPDGVAGKKAVITFTADGADGSNIKLTHPVVLTGGK